jgi:hypothetical protein
MPPASSSTPGKWAGPASPRPSPSAPSSSAISKASIPNAASPDGPPIRSVSGTFREPDSTNAAPISRPFSRTRRLIAVETQEQVFGFVLRVIAARGLLKGKTIGVDATTLEANAAMRSIVRRDTGDNYQEFLTGLAPKF